MAKKPRLFIAAVFIVAVAVPAIASAAPATDPPGTLVPVGTKIEWTSTNMVTETSLGKITCANLTITGEVTINTPSLYVGSGSGTSSASTCFLGGTKAITITDITWPEDTSSTSGKGTWSLTFKADLPGGITCHFESASMPYTYTPGSSEITFTKADMKASPAACEPGLFSAGLTRETDNTNVHIILD